MAFKICTLVDRGGEREGAFWLNNSIDLLSGILLALATTFSFAVYSVAIVPVMRVHSPLIVSTASCLIGGSLLGALLRRWLPELSGLPAETIHKPWTAARKLPPDLYPERIVDHGAARDRALQAFRGLKRVA